MRKVPPSTKTSCWRTRSVSHWRSSSVRLVQPDARSRTARSRAIRGRRSLMIMCVLVHRFRMVDHTANTMPTAGVGGRHVSTAIELNLAFATDYPGATPDFLIALGRSGGVGFGVGRVGRVPVQHPLGDIAGHVVQAQGVGRPGARGHLMINDAGVAVVARSEERRVGKECRSGRGPVT